MSSMSVSQLPTYVTRAMCVACVETADQYWVGQPTARGPTCLSHPQWTNYSTRSRERSRTGRTRLGRSFLLGARWRMRTTSRSRRSAGRWRGCGSRVCWSADRVAASSSRSPPDADRAGRLWVGQPSGQHTAVPSAEKRRSCDCAQALQSQTTFARLGKCVEAERAAERQAGARSRSGRPFLVRSTQASRGDALGHVRAVVKVGLSWRSGGLGRSKGTSMVRRRGGPRRGARP